MFFQSLDNNLLPNEKIIFRTKKHWIIFLVPVVLTLITLGFLFNNNSFVIKLAFVPVIATLLAWANQLLLYWSSEFAVTTKRIIMKEGFFFKHTNEALLTAISSTSVDQSLLGQILNYGTVVIYTFGNADPFVQIAAPNEFQKQLQIQLSEKN
jgi:uncharacterized membrane protein YdbT with pleckstrin-like domain